MAFNVINEASEDSAAYSPIPFRFKDDEVGTVGYYNYLVYLIIEPTGIDSISLNSTSQEYTITTLRPHKMKVGDDVVLYNTGNVVDNNTVIKVISDDKFIIPVNDTISGSIPDRLGRYLTYRQAPDVRGEAKFDFSNVLRDFVETTFANNFSPINAVETKVKYEVLTLKVTQPTLEFADDIFVLTPGAINDIGFVFPNTTVDEVSNSFKIGDTVNIEREDQTYSYINSFNNGRNIYEFFGSQCYLDIPKTNQGGFQPDGTYNPIVNQTLFVNPNNNGVNEGNTNAPLGYGPFNGPPYSDIYDFIPYSDASTVTGVGTITGQVNINYNGITTIRAINQEGVNVHIGIEKVYGYSSPAVPGTMSLVNSTVVSETILYNSGPKYAYVGRQPQYEYDLNFMFTYVKRAFPNIKEFSTIYSSGDIIQVERNTKQNLLCHIGNDININGVTADINYFDVNNSFLGKTEYDLNNYVSFNADDDYDFYIPGNLEGWFGGNNTVGSSLPSVFNEVGYYRINLVDSGNFNIPLFNQMVYKIYDECSAYEVYELIWKDRMGSYISYPFAFKHKETMEVTRNSYYKEDDGFQDDGSFELASYRKGKKEFFNKSKDKFTLNSGWATDKESEYIKDMFQSTDVYLKLPTGKIIGCNILGNSIEVKKKQNFDLFNYQINVVTSLQDIRL